VKEIGTAMSVNGGKVTVSVKRTAACEACGKCTHPAIALGDNSILLIEAISAGDIKPGDTVEVDMDSGEFLKASFFVWLLPVVATGAGLGLGWVFGSVVGNGGLWGGVFALGALVLSYFWLHQYDRSSQKAGRYLPLARPVRDTQW